MFAVIKTGGKQYRVQEGDILEIEKIPAEAGQQVAFDQVLLIDDGDKTVLGTPFVENASVRGEVVENFKGEKVLVFKKKRRKQFRRTRGHRQPLIRVRIENILADAAGSPLETKAVPVAKPEKKEAAVQPVEEKPVIKEEKKAEKKAEKKEAKLRDKAAASNRKKMEEAKKAKTKKAAAAKKTTDKKSSK